MTKVHWADLAGMPIRTRLLCMAAGRGRDGVATMKAEEIARRRALTPDPRFPVTLVTGRVRQHIVRDVVRLPMRDGIEIPARIHRRADVGGEAPVVIYYHGGGWTLGRPLDYESILTMIADETGAVVVAPDYRKAPEHKAPAAVLDAHDTLDLVLAGDARIPVTPRRVAVAGDSAGGNLAALAALRAGAALAGQVLIYPAVDLGREHSYRNAPLLDGDALDTYKALYLEGASVDADDPQVSPLRAATHAGAAPALIQIAEFDPLAAEGADYAAALERSGVPTRLTHYRGVPHGFVSIPGAAPVASQARWEIIDALQGWLA